MLSQPCGHFGVIDGQDVAVGLQKGLPGRFSLAVRRRLDALILEDVGDSMIRRTTSDEFKV